MRLDRYLAASGLGSREFVKNLIKKGRITVEGVQQPEPETKVGENTAVFFDGKPVKGPGPVYLMLHKPAGYLTAVTDSRNRTVMELVPGNPPDLAPVGRLDKDAEGLLLFTNDGALAHRLLDPKRGIPKTYFVRTESAIPEDAVRILAEPVVFKDFTSRPAVLEILSEKEARVTVTEGRFHEVKRLMHAAGSDVTYLKRIAFGSLALGDLKKGETRELHEEEIRALKTL